MRRLFPQPGDLHLDELYDGLVLDDGGAEAAAGRSWVALGMVCSLDGAATVAGRTAELGGAADRLAFQRLRDASDAILVGAETVRVEGYRPPIGTAERRAGRRERGLAEVPRLVIVSGSLELPLDLPLLRDPDNPPLVVTHGAVSRERLATVEEVAEVVEVGRGPRVDLARLLGLLARRGLGRVLCEGGPRLAGALLADDLIDEVFLTIAPSLVGGPASRIVQAELEVARHLAVVSAYEHEGELLLRYTRPPGGG